MAHIQTVSPRADRGELRHAYREFRRELVGRVDAVTGEPGGVTPHPAPRPAGTATARESLDAVGVMLGFNFITRVASALGVQLDFWLRLPHLKAAPAFTAGVVAWGLGQM